MRQTLSVPSRLGAGLAGAVVLTAANELGHRLLSEARRLDVLGMRALVRGMRWANTEPPRGRAIPRAALAFDLLTNGLFYAATLGRRRRRRSLIGSTSGGLAMGALAALVAPWFGMNRREGYGWGRRLAMVGLYTLGGLATGAIARSRRW